jgi:hypothetical protein
MKRIIRNLDFMKQLITLFFSAMMLLGTSSCHRDKISCPTYAYSFPFPNEKPKKKKLSALSPNKMGKNTRTASDVLPRNAK